MAHFASEDSPDIYVDQPYMSDKVRVTIYEGWKARQSPAAVLTFAPAHFVRLANQLKAFADTLGVTVIERESSAPKDT